jgi:hypothetical protein
MKSGTARVGEHVQNVEFLLRWVFGHAIGLHLHPSLLPFLFNVSKIVFHIDFYFVISQKYLQSYEKSGEMQKENKFFFSFLL